MSLNVYTRKDFIPSGVVLIDSNDSYFEGCGLIPDTELSHLILREIDKATRASDLYFTPRNPDVGNLSRNNLSTGTKTLLNIINTPSLCFSLVECGDNALELLPLIRHGNVFWEHPVAFVGAYDACDIVLNSQISFSSYTEFLNYCLYGG